LLKETTVAFEGARNRYLHITSQTRNPLRQVKLKRDLVLFNRT